jgi:hypothetical protein
MKTLALHVAGIKVGELLVQDVRGCAWGPYRISTNAFIIDLTADQAQELADMVTHQVPHAIVGT